MAKVGRPVGSVRKKPTVVTSKRPVGRPKKYLTPEIKGIVRTIQNAPFNQVNPLEWTELLGRLAIFQKETHRPSIANALYVLLDSGLKSYEKEKEINNG